MVWAHPPPTTLPQWDLNFVANATKREGHMRSIVNTKVKWAGIL